ncbi:MAG: hypothetical protein IIT48_02760 [Lachnospiraceae bacterium]|nr:hypothetical protein [Lachnospiraceae bacterium]
MKATVSKILILLLLFLAVTAVGILLGREKENKTEIIMGEPTLPTVTLYGSTGNSDETMEINELFGYKSQMEAKYMRDTITPICGSRNLTIHVKNYNNYIMGASFELRSLDCERLIENTTVDSSMIKAKGDYTDISLTFQDMIDMNTEYVFVLHLNTDHASDVYYYTRVIQLGENHIVDDVNFLNGFSDATFAKESDKISKYIEPNDTMDNSNFGHVNINSTYTMITWDNLKPEKVTTPIVSVKEILGNIGCFQLSYKIKALNDAKEYDYYDVKEYFRIKCDSGNMYLLDYDRTTNQIFDMSNVSTSRVNLGISENSNNEFKASESGKYIAFAKKNGLWLMDIKNNKLKSLFAFESPEDDDKRDNNTDSDVHIVSADDKGNVKFIVCGYMNRGEHEGMVGVSLYNYDAEKNVINEKIFIPFARQYGILKQMMGRMFYVNDKDIMYIMLSDNVYSVDLSGSEYVSIVTDAEANHFASNESSSLIAWEDESSDNTKINILNLDTGKKSEINAESGKKINVVGFIGNDFAYGISEAEDIISGATTKYAMNRLVILDEDGNEQKDYQKDGYYFSNATIENNMINVSRFVREDGGAGFAKADDYQIFGNEEQESSVAASKIITTESKKQEHTITFAKKVTTSKQLKNVYPKDITFTNTNALNMHELLSDSENYYVYTKGRLTQVTKYPAQAVAMADEAAGVAIGENGDYFYARTEKPKTYEISSLNLNMENIPSMISKDMTGINLQEALYFISHDNPVMAMTSDTEYVVIKGYDFANVTLVNPSSGETYKMGQEEAAAAFANASNRFSLLIR